MVMDIKSNTKKYLSTRSIIDPIVYSAVLGYESESKRLEKIWQDNLDMAREARYFTFQLNFPWRMMV